MRIFLLLLALLCVQNTWAGVPEIGDNIRLNQIGFYPYGPKTAIILTSKSKVFYIQNLNGTTVFTGELKEAAGFDLAGKPTRIANFSTYHTSGKYRLYIPDIGYSYPFLIGRAVYHNVASASVKAYYFMRASIPLAEKYAGKWHRAEGHPDTNVIIHASAATAIRLTGTVISASRGWYDAGDYNKYMVNSGISTATLLSLYEDFPDYMNTVKLNIPESGNSLPDILNEVLWNLRWMLTMQDLDGGVYHKLTNAAFDKMEMPDQALAPRYVVQKSTAATLDFAAVMAQASRVFRKFSKQVPGLADSCLNQAYKAWGWAVKNRSVIYDQDKINKLYDPKITTGAYGDTNLSDEFIWAAAELFVSTKQPQFLKGINMMPDDSMPVPTWSDVKLLGYYTLIKNSNRLGGGMFINLAELKRRLLAMADDMIAGTNKTAYQTIMQKSALNFNWGSNSVAANQGIALIQAYKLTSNSKYLLYALNNLDYILGRNGTGYSFITGYGSKTPMHPHHRPSIADGIMEPYPGFLVGGPNPGMQDGIRLASVVPDEAYIDNDRAYAVNEVAINWNAPFAYLANAIEALQYKLPINPQISN